MNINYFFAGILTAVILFNTDMFLLYFHELISWFFGAATLSDAILFITCCVGFWYALEARRSNKHMNVQLRQNKEQISLYKKQMQDQHAYFVIGTKAKFGCKLVNGKIFVENITEKEMKDLEISLFQNSKKYNSESYQFPPAKIECQIGSLDDLDEGNEYGVVCRYKHAYDNDWPEFVDEFDLVYKQDGWCVLPSKKKYIMK